MFNTRTNLPPQRPRRSSDFHIELMTAESDPEGRAMPGTNESQLFSLVLEKVSSPFLPLLQVEIIGIQGLAVDSLLRDWRRDSYNASAILEGSLASGASEPDSP